MQDAIWPIPGLTFPELFLQHNYNVLKIDKVTDKLQWILDHVKVTSHVTLRITQRTSLITSFQPSLQGSHTLRYWPIMVKNLE